MSHLGLGLPNVLLLSSLRRSGLPGSRAHLLGAGLGAMPGAGHGVRHRLALMDMGAPLAQPLPRFVQTSLFSKQLFWPAAQWP